MIVCFKERLMKYLEGHPFRACVLLIAFFEKRTDLRFPAVVLGRLSGAQTNREEGAGLPTSCLFSSQLGCCPLHGTHGLLATLTASGPSENWESLA